MSEQNIADGTVETPSVEDLQARLAKAEAKIVELKKSDTKEVKEEVKAEETKVETAEAPTPGLSKDELEAFYTEKKFYESNPDMVEYKDKFAELTSKGLDFETAKTVIEAQDPTIANRKKAKQINFTSWEAGSEPLSFTRDQLEDPNLSQEDYNRMRDLIDQGKATFKD